MRKAQGEIKEEDKMAKYDVVFSCGHTETKDIFGKASERESKIAYWEKYGICSCCYRRQKDAENSADCNEVEMFYGDYKRNYPECKTKANSYNRETKTIIVYVPVGM